MELACAVFAIATASPALTVLPLSALTVETAVATVVCLAGATACPCGTATSAPAEIAITGAALPAFSATFSTCDG